MVFRLAGAALCATWALTAAQMPLGEDGKPKFGEETFDPSDYHVREYDAMPALSTALLHCGQNPRRACCHVCTDALWLCLWSAGA